MKRPLQERLLDRVCRAESGCWEWSGPKDKCGYGQFRVWKKGTFLAHRLFYQMFCGPLTRDVHVLHMCDNPCCCNPVHLKSGSHLDNMRDMAAKGRAAPFGTGKRSPRYLDDEDRAAIRKAYQKGSAEHGLRSLARQFGVGVTTIARVIRTGHPSSPA